MGTITFIKTANTEEHVFSKDTFKYMYTSYTSGIYGSILLYFAILPYSCINFFLIEFEAMTDIN